jgi:dihydrofolate synthase
MTEIEPTKTTIPHSDLKFFENFAFNTAKVSSSPLCRRLIRAPPAARAFHSSSPRPFPITGFHRSKPIHSKKALYKSAIDFEKAKLGQKRHWKARIGTTFSRARAKLIQEDVDWRYRLNPKLKQDWSDYVEDLQSGTIELDQEWGAREEWLIRREGERKRSIHGLTTEQKELVGLWKRGIIPFEGDLKDPERRKKWGLPVHTAAAGSLKEMVEGSSETEGLNDEYLDEGRKPLPGTLKDMMQSSPEQDARKDEFTDGGHQKDEDSELLDLWNKDFKFPPRPIDQPPEDHTFQSREQIQHHISQTLATTTPADRAYKPYVPLSRLPAQTTPEDYQTTERVYGGNSPRARADVRAQQKEREEMEELSGIRVPSRTEFLEKLRKVRENEQVKERTPEEAMESPSLRGILRVASSERLGQVIDTMQEHRRESSPSSQPSEIMPAQSKISLTLERITRLLNVLDNPQDQLKCIHVAGTNGKGSVCTYLTSSLIASGLRTGQFTSPHLLDRWDCITLNQSPIPAATFHALESEILALNTKHAFEATSFEILTAVAFTYFAREKVDVAVIETGMGGRLDATNVIKQPLVSVITSIALDHARFLGHDITEIAAHKAGIIKPNCPVVVTPQRSHVHEIFVKKAAEEKAPFHSALGFWRNAAQQRYFVENVVFQDADPRSTPMLGVVPGIAGGEQGGNIACAVKALSLLRERWGGITEEAVQRGIASAKLAGRMEWVHLDVVEGRVPMLVDGAHNPASLTALATFVKPLRGNAERPVVWLVAFSGERDVDACMARFIREGDSVAAVEIGPVDGMEWVKPVSSDLVATEARFLTKDYLAEDMALVEKERITSFGRDLEGALRWCVREAKEREGVFVATGSLYLVSDIYRLKRDKPQLFRQSSL